MTLHKRLLVDVNQPPRVSSPVSRPGSHGFAGTRASLTVTTREDRCAAGCQVHVGACLSMSAIALCAGVAASVPPIQHTVCPQHALPLDSMPLVHSLQLQCTSIGML